MIIGTQCFTIRESCKTLEGLDESLKKVADIGYTAVQLSGVCPYEPEWMAEKLKAYGLVAPITHFSYDKIVNETEETIRFHDIIGAKYIGIGSMPGGPSVPSLVKMVADLFPVLDKITESGHKFMYHNHHREFALMNGKNYLELICSAFPAEKCGITLDTYWAMAGGADPIQWLKKLKGRVDCVHFKDMVFNPQDKAVRMAPIGSGNMNYEGIIEACLESGVEYGFVEQDRCYDEDPFVCLKKSFEYFKAHGIN